MQQHERGLSVDDASPSVVGVSVVCSKEAVVFDKTELALDVIFVTSSVVSTSVLVLLAVVLNSFWPVVVIVDVKAVLLSVESTAEVE